MHHPRFREQDRPPTVMAYSMRSYYIRFYMLRQFIFPQKGTSARNYLFDIFEAMMYNIDIEHTDKRSLPKY